MEDRFALLIDADNVSAKYIQPILDELSKYGKVTYKRIYGDWTRTNNASWKEELLQNSITPIQQFSYTSWEKCDGFGDDHRCDGYAVYERSGGFLPCVQRQ